VLGTPRPSSNPSPAMSHSTAQADVAQRHPEFPIAPRIAIHSAPPHPIPSQSTHAIAGASLTAHHPAPNPHLALSPTSPGGHPGPSWSTWIWDNPAGAPARLRLHPTASPPGVGAAHLRPGHSAGGSAGSGADAATESAADTAVWGEGTPPGGWGRGQWARRGAVAGRRVEEEGDEDDGDDDGEDEEVEQAEESKKQLPQQQHHLQHQHQNQQQHRPLRQPRAAPQPPKQPAWLATGRLVWAKAPQFPWWPALVLAPGDPAMPAGSPEPGPQQSAVRFFGPGAEVSRAAVTDGRRPAACPQPPPHPPPPDHPLTHPPTTHRPQVAIMDHRSLSPWVHAQSSARASRSKAAAFVQAVKEARAFAKEGALPAAFEEPAEALFGAAAAAAAEPAGAAAEVAAPQQQSGAGAAAASSGDAAAQRQERRGAVAVVAGGGKKPKVRLPVKGPPGAAASTPAARGSSSGSTSAALAAARRKAAARVPQSQQ
jgi:hypothetical protein